VDSFGFGEVMVGAGWIWPPLGLALGDARKQEQGGADFDRAPDGRSEGSGTLDGGFGLCGARASVGAGHVRTARPATCTDAR